MEDVESGGAEASIEARTSSPVRPIGGAALRALTRRRGSRAATSILIQWTVIGGAVAGAVTIGWPAYPLAVVVVATRQHALAVLMHEGAHRLLFRRRWLNDLASDVLLAFPLFVSTQRYREHHLRHHRFLNTPRDPDLDTVSVRRTPRQWVRIAVGDLTGMNMLKTVDSVGQFSVLGLRGASGDPRRRRLARIQLLGYGVHVAVVSTLLTVTGAWPEYLLLWVLPAITVLNFLLRIRAIAEHVACPNQSVLDATRTVLPSVIERWTLAPCNVNFHLEHHLHPRVPQYNLRKLRRLLSTDARFATITPTRSYLLGRDSVRAEVLAAHAAIAN